MTMNRNMLADFIPGKDEACFGKHPFIFQSEVEALRSKLPVGNNLRGTEIGLGTGKFTEALGIHEGVESSQVSRKIALTRGLKVIEGVAEDLPYKEQSFDFVVMVLCISHFNDLHVAFQEANRVLRKEGVLIIGFIDRSSIIGKILELKDRQYPKNREVNLYSVDKVIFELNLADFKQFNICQTLFNESDKISCFEPAKPGYGEGSFVVIQAKKGF
jgi:SAM-dependent methyltransferase